MNRKTYLISWLLLGVVVAVTYWSNYMIMGYRGWVKQAAVRDYMACSSFADTPEEVDHCLDWAKENDHWQPFPFWRYALLTPPDTKHE